MRKFLRKFTINLLAKHLFKTIVEEDLLRVRGGKMYVRGQELTQEQTEILREQAFALQDSMLWRYLKLDLKHQAIRKTLNDSQTMEDVISGKLLLYLIDVVEKRLENLHKGR